MAFSLLSSPKVAEALDVRREPQSTRELYGMTLYGQGCLAARRMIEAGTKLATVFWDEYGLAGDAWDTHFGHYPRMKDQLMPGFDKAYSGLILDLERRGMLDDTLIVMGSEFGRTPKISSLSTKAKPGRDHWGGVQTLFFAGGGIKGGRVLGASDKFGKHPISDAKTPEDLAATIYDTLGLPKTLKWYDKSERPHFVYHGEPMSELF